MSLSNRWRVGFDIGGTFTDFVLYDAETHTVRLHKRLTTPHDPSEAALLGLSEILKMGGIGYPEVSEIVHGTTLVTNAVIERKGAVTGMLVTKGFKDVLDIALERRYDLFDLRLRFPDPLVPRRMRAEIDERIRYDGTIERPLDIAATVQAVRQLVDEHNIKALAICFLHSYRNPEHEEQAIAFLKEKFKGLYISASAEVFPNIREYERWTTTTRKRIIARKLRSEPGIVSQASGPCV